VDSHEYPDHLLKSFVELSKLLLIEESIETTLDVLSQLAVSTIPGCDVASVSLLKDGYISTMGSSDPIAIEIDAIQYQTGEGPCLDAIGKKKMWFQLDDMSKDTQWPSFSRQAAGRGLESLLAFTLKVDDDVLGALNLFARAPAVFTKEDRETGAIYAGHAAIALANAQVHSKNEHLQEELRRILISKQIIGQAQGILMERDFRSAEQALGALEGRAQELRNKLEASAHEVIEATDRERAELSLPEGLMDKTVERARSEKPSQPSQG